MSSPRFQKGNKINVGRKRPDVALRNKAPSQRLAVSIFQQKYRVGKNQIEETKKKISYTLGSKTGFVTPKNALIRSSTKYRNWRTTIFERDDYTCLICNRKEEVSGKLQADHIKPFAYFPELRFELSNGRTLCIDCHKKTDTYAHKM